MNDSIFAADTTNVQAGGTSFFDSLSDAVTKGAPSAVISGLASIANTGIDVANFFGAEKERINVHDVISDVDENWGTYYEQHQGVIDTAGFIATSFIPGGLAVKGLNLFRRGEGAGAFARALNYTTTQQTKNLEAALQTIASPEGSVFTRMNANYLKSLSWGVADQVLQTAAFEIAVATTMKASPMLDQESFGDISHDIIKNALFGGVFGGTIEGIFLHGITKDAISTVDRAQRKYDVLGATDKLGLGAADTAYSFANAALKLPKEVAENDRLLDFAYKLNGKTNPFQFKTGERFDAALQKTVTNAVQDMERIVTTKLAVEGDTTVGAPLAKMAIGIFAEGKKNGLADEAIQQRLGEVFFNLNKVEPLGAVSDVTPTKLHFFDKAAPAPGKGAFPLAETGTGNTFRLLVDPSELVIKTAGEKGAMTASEAWESGADLFYKTNGEWAINPKSSNVKKAQQPSGYQLILNTTNGTADFKATPSIADVATKEVPLSVNGNTVVAGDRSWRFKVGDNPEELVGADSTYNTARHLWASTLQHIEGKVSENDFSVLDAMVKDPRKIAEGTTVVVDGLEKDWRSFGNFQNWVLNNKLISLKATLETGEQDIQHLAYQLNTTPEWVQNAISSNFKDLSPAAANAPDVLKGWTRELSDYGEREHVVLTYGDRNTNFFTGNKETYTPILDAGKPELMNDSYRNFTTGQMGWQYRVKLAQDNLNMAFGSVFAEDALKFINLNVGEIEKLADRNATGAGIVSFANANYFDKLRLWSQDTGKLVHLLAQKIANTNLGRIQPLMAELSNGTARSNAAAAELTAIVTRIRRSGEDFTILGDEYGLNGSYLVNKSLLKGLDKEEHLQAIQASLMRGTEGVGSDVYPITNQLTADFLEQHMAINGEMIEKRAALAVSRGQVSLRKGDTLYIPPVDTTKVQYFAFVRPTDGRVFGDDNVSMILAKSDRELQEKASQIGKDSGLQVIFKKDSEKFFKAKGDYDYQRSLNDAAVDSDLRKSGRLGDYMPSFDVQSTLEDFLNYHQRQATQLVRDGVSTKYAQQIAEFTRLSEEYTLAQGSKFGVVDKLLNRSLKDPYDDLIKGALDISKRSEFTLLHQTNEMLDALGTRAYRASREMFDGLAAKGAKATDTEWTEANTYLNRLGLGTPFKDEMAYEIARTPADRNLLKTALQKANLILSTGVLRLDFANSLVNIISTPIMLGAEVSSLRKSIANDPELLARFNGALSVAVPEGGGVAVPSTTKLIANSLRNYWGPEKDALIKRFTENGDINSQSAIFHEMIEDLSLKANLNAGEYSSKVSKWVDTAAKVTGNTHAEQLTRFVSADVMRQITEPLYQSGKMSLQEQNAFISIFVNRVQGNYIASQRPILFQGTLGSAVGLFQTYQFNMLQQLFRHIENRDLKSVAVMGGLQTSIYGMNGLPMFDAINTHLIGNASINNGHKDAYSYATQAAGEWGDWLMYGTASALPIFGAKGPALYTRGDLNPRQMTIIPVNPKDIPAVDATTRFVGNLINTASKIANGGDIGSSLLEGLEHNSINRPLAGLAQALNGASTTSKGSLITGNQDLFSISNASRILGAKPLDEAVGLNTKFRQLAYQAEDKARLEDLGAAVKTTLRGNRVPSDEQMTEFMGKYAASGGQIQNFGQAMQKWSKDANVSVLNQLADKTRSPYGQRFVEVMGGKSITDFRNTPPAPEETP